MARLGRIGRWWAPENRRRALGLLVALLAVGLTVGSGNVLALLPIAPLILLMAIEGAPAWTRVPAERLAWASLYASVTLWLVIAAKLVLRGEVSEQTWWCIGMALEKTHAWLEVLGNPYVMVPVILVAGAVSFITADPRLIVWLGRWMDRLGTLSLAIYLLSLVTLFTAQQAEAIAGSARARVDAYRLAIDQQRQALAEFLARGAVLQAAQSAVPQQQAALAEALRTLSEEYRPSAARPLSTISPVVAEAVASLSIRAELRQALPGAPVAAADAAAAPDEPKVAADYTARTDKSRHDTAVVAARGKTLTATLNALFATFLGAAELDEAATNVVGDVVASVQSKYVDPMMQRWTSGASLLHDALAGIVVVGPADLAAALPAAARAAAQRISDIRAAAAALAAGYGDDAIHVTRPDFGSRDDPLRNELRQRIEELTSRGGKAATER
jgi:hypothetical protein